MLVSLGVLFAASEVALRIADARAGRGADFFVPPADLDSAMYIPHPYLGVVHRPGWTRDNLYQVSINSLGLRGPEVSVEKPAGVYRIACVGASTTFGTGATSDDKTYPAQLERLLNAQAAAGRVQDGRRFEVLNGGVSGTNSADTLINFQLRLLELDLDAVLVYHAANDGRVIQARGFKADYSHFRRSPPILRISTLERFLLGHVRTYAHLVQGTDPEQQLGTLADWVFVPGYKQLMIRSTEWINEEGLAVFMGNLTDLAAVARAHDVLPVFSTFAVRQTDSTAAEAGLAPFVARANQEIAALAQALDVPLVDVARELDGKPEFYDDWVHFNDKGELRHAQVVLGEAMAQGLFGLTTSR